MENEITIVRGPSSTRLTKEAAATELQKLPGFPEDATYHIDEIDGRWVAAVVWPKQAGPFPPSDDEPAGPPTDGPPSEPPADGPPSAEDEGEKPPKAEGEKDGDKPSSDGAPKEDGKLSVEHQLANLTDMLTKITDALGLSTPADGMIPGADDGAVPPPGLDGPPGPPGDVPPGGPEEASPDKHQTIRHERSMKPGEAPPGTTPVSAPSFASVQDDHPWKAAIEAGVKEFEVESPIGDTPLYSVAATLKELAEPYGLVVTDLAPSGYGTERTASARIVRTR